MTTLSSHVSLPLPDHWTPEQALAISELLTDLAETVWTQYELALIELLAPQPEQDETSQPDLFDDPLPF